MIDIILVTNDQQLSMSFQAAFKEGNFFGECIILSEFDSIPLNKTGISFIDMSLSTDAQQYFHILLKKSCSPSFGIITKSSNYYDGYDDCFSNESNFKEIIRKGFYEKLYCIANRKNIKSN